MIEVTDQKDWKDGTYAAGATTGLSGVTHLFDLAFRGGHPQPAQPVAAVVHAHRRDRPLNSGYTFPLKRERVVVRPAQTGRLYLYVNDAINNALGMELDFDAAGHRRLSARRRRAAKRPERGLVRPLPQQRRHGDDYSDAGPLGWFGADWEAVASTACPRPWRHIRPPRARSGQQLRVGCSSRAP